VRRLRDRAGCELQVLQRMRYACCGGETGGIQAGHGALRLCGNGDPPVAIAHGGLFLSHTALLTSTLMVLAVLRVKRLGVPWVWRFFEDRQPAAVPIDPRAVPVHHDFLKFRQLTAF